MKNIILYLPKIEEPWKEKIYFIGLLNYDKRLEMRNEDIIVWLSCEIGWSKKVLQNVNLFFPSMEFSWGIKPKGFLLSVSPIESKCTESKETKLKKHLKDCKQKQKYTQKRCVNLHVKGVERVMLASRPVGGYLKFMEG